MRRAVTVRVPAKVNLQLSVGAPRADGYHDVVSVFQAVGLHDDVTVTPAAAGSGVSITVDGEGEGEIPLDGTNLASRAVEMLADRAGIDPDVHVHLRKQIPVAGGMAGGSADAAGTVVAVDALWGTRLDRAEMIEVAASLGADVPFALVGGTAVGVDRGDHLTPALARGQYSWVFAIADDGLSTPDVYAELDRLRDGSFHPEPRVSDQLMQALRAGDAEAVGRSVINDLQRAAVGLRPRLSMTLEVGEEYGALGAIVSGSGPTCAFLARDDDHALDLAVALSAAGVCRTVKRALGPVPGARVVDA